METLKFNAEVKKVEATKLANLDVGYKITLFTDEASVLALGALPGDSILNVEIGVQE